MSHLPHLGDAGASIAVSLAALIAFVGRILLARFADQVDLRTLTAGVMICAAIYGLMRDMFGGALAAAINLITAIIIFWGGRKVMPAPN